MYIYKYSLYIFMYMHTICIRIHKCIPSAGEETSIGGRGKYFKKSVVCAFHFIQYISVVCMLLETFRNSQKSLVYFFYIVYVFDSGLTFEKLYATQMCRVTHRCQSTNTCIRVMFHVPTGHVTFINESCPICARIMSHTLYVI